jgi:2-oxoglutarate dehydrogenase E2 component (dihydrolipoamide succinyltransferase)
MTTTAERAATSAPAVGTQLTSVVEVDLTGLPSGAVLATVAAAAVRAAAEHPVVVRARGVHLAVLDADGTTQAVVADADELTPAALAARIGAGQDAGAAPSLAVVDTGSRGVLVDTPAVGPARTAVLGIGATVRRPVVMPTDGGEAIVVRAMAHLSLSYDAELLGGGDAADFLRSVQRHLREVAA